MYTSEDVLEAARVIRPYLPNLLGAEAETVERALAELLARAESGEAVDNQILELLAEYDATREWAPPRGSTANLRASAYVSATSDSHVVDSGIVRSTGIPAGHVASACATDSSKPGAARQLKVPPTPRLVGWP